MNWNETPYEKRVQELEDEGLTRSDAQVVASLEFMQKAAPKMLRFLENCVKLKAAFKSARFPPGLEELIAKARGEA